MQTPDELVRDLLDRWTGDDEHPGDGGPGLLRRLDDVERTGQPQQAGGHAPPGSRPPGSLDAASWLVRICSGAIVLDMELRGSPYAQSWERALRAIPPNAEASDRVREAASTLGRWHSTCRTVLGLQPPSRTFEGVACLVCGEKSIRGRADRDRPRAWCTNPACQDEDDAPARYEGERFWILTENLAAASAAGPPQPSAELLLRAFKQAQAHESALAGLQQKLTGAGLTYASHYAHAAAEAIDVLVQQLGDDLITAGDTE